MSNQLREDTYLTTCFIYIHSIHSLAYRTPSHVFFSVLAITSLQERSAVERYSSSGGANTYATFYVVM